MPTVTVNDINIYYEIAGENKKETIIFIAGFCSDHNVWTEIKNHFAKTHQVIVIDNRGAGQSDCPDVPYTIDMIAEDVISLCQMLGIEFSHFVGSSMGGAIVQTLAYKYPQRVRSITLSNSFMQIDIKFSLFAQGMLELFKTNILATTWAKLFLGWCFSSSFLSQPGKIETMLELAAANPHPMRETAYKNQLHALLNFNSQSWIHKIQTPCLIIGSDQDMIVSKTHFEHMTQQIPNSVYHCFNNIGHVSFAEQPEAYIHILTDFLEKLSSAQK